MRTITYSRGFLLALIVSGLSSAAWAQVKPAAPVGSWVKRDPEKAEIWETRTILFEYGRCVVARSYRKAADYVLDMSRVDFDERYGELRSPDCLMLATSLNRDEISLRLPGDLLRFTVAEALVARDLANFDPARLATAQLLAFPTPEAAADNPRPARKYSAKELEEKKLDLRGRIAFWRYGDCIVRTDPHNARVLLRSKPTSAEETAAFNALMPALGGCVKQGDQIKSNRTMLRGTIALHYYRLARAPQAPPIQQQNPR